MLKSKIIALVFVMPIMMAFSLISLDTAHAGKNTAVKALKKAGRAEAKAARLSGKADAARLKAINAEKEAGDARNDADNAILDTMEGGYHNQY